MFVTAPPGDAERIFVVEQTGVIRIIRDGATLPSPFLDIRDKVKVSSEPGLLSVAFAPDYETSGLFYVFYNSTAGNGDIHISEFRRHPTDPDLADPYSERILLTIPKPWENHNGGMLQFGPDGFLYASVGDGDSGTLYPPGFFAQRRDDLLGDILRIDPRAGDPYGIPADNPFVALDGVRPEIWAYGLRNPWRFWIDGDTQAMFIADAGNAREEEVDRVPLDIPGANFGWPCFEGSLPFDATAVCDGAQPPLLDYPREGGACVVIGGVVARDPATACARWALPVRRLLLREGHRRGGRERPRHGVGRSRAQRPGAHELRRGRGRADLRGVAPRRRLPPRSEVRLADQRRDARDRISAAHAAALRPIQIGVNST